MPQSQISDFNQVGNEWSMAYWSRAQFDISFCRVVTVIFSSVFNFSVRTKMTISVGSDTGRVASGSLMQKLGLNFTYWSRPWRSQCTLFILKEVWESAAIKSAERWWLLRATCLSTQPPLCNIMWFATSWISWCHSCFHFRIIMENIAGKKFYWNWNFVILLQYSAWIQWAL